MLICKRCQGTFEKHKCRSEFTTKIVKNKFVRTGRMVYRYTLIYPNPFTVKTTCKPAHTIRTFELRRLAFLFSYCSSPRAAQWPKQSTYGKNKRANSFVTSYILLKKVTGREPVTFHTARARSRRSNRLNHELR